MSDRETLEPILTAQTARIYDYSFANHIIWRKLYDGAWCLRDGALYLTVQAHGPERGYHLPLFADGGLDAARLRAAMEPVFHDAAEHSVPLRLLMLTREMCEALEEAFPGRFAFEEKRDQADYLYDTAAVASVAGKKYHAKRNFIHRFEAQYTGRWRLEELDDANLGAVWAFNERWYRKNEYSSPTQQALETEVVCAALRGRQSLGMRGVVLWVDERVVAYAMGSRLNADTYLEQVEKADGDIPGAYPMITRAFAETCAAGFAWLNREEDMGIEGLRQAKLSWNPARLILRYEAGRKPEQGKDA